MSRRSSAVAGGTEISSHHTRRSSSTSAAAEPVLACAGSRVPTVCRPVCASRTASSRAREKSFPAAPAALVAEAARVIARTVAPGE